MTRQNLGIFHRCATRHFLSYQKHALPKSRGKLAEVFHAGHQPLFPYRADMKLTAIKTEVSDWPLTQQETP
jgi:hypothetical protein